MSEVSRDTPDVHAGPSEEHRSEEVLTRLLESAPDYAVLTVDMTGRINSWTPGAARMFGSTEQEILGRGLDLLEPPGSRLLRELQGTLPELAGADRRELELLLSRREGKTFAAQVVLAPLTSEPHGTDTIVVIVHDITRQQARLREVRDQKRRLRSIVETAVDAIIIIDDRGLIDSVNHGTERMFGYTQEELLGRNVSLLMPEPFSSEHDGYIQRYLQTGRARIIGIGRTVQGRRKDGTLFPADLAVSEFEDGRPYFTGILRDISERKALEAEVLHIAETEQRRIGQELHDDVQQQVTGLTLMASHLADALKRAANDNPELATLQTTAARITQGLRDTNQSLRELARGLIPLHIDAQGLTAALAGLAKRIQELHAVDCSFASTIERTSQERLPATHLYRIAQEAVQNALKHASAREVTIRLLERDQMITLEIADNGVGIPAEACSSGRGLHIMAYRADLIGAVLTIRRGEAGGTVVACSLPLPRLADAERSA